MSDCMVGTTVNKFTVVPNGKYMKVRLLTDNIDQFLSNMSSPTKYFILCEFHK